MDGTLKYYLIRAIVIGWIYIVSMIIINNGYLPWHLILFSLLLNVGLILIDTEDKKQGWD